MDLSHSQVEYLSNSTRREPPFEDFRVERSILIEKTERSDTTNLQYSIFNIQFRLARVGCYSYQATVLRRICYQAHIKYLIPEGQLNT